MWATDRLMRLAASHAWSRQDTLTAAAEQSLLQAVRSAEEGVVAAVPCTRDDLRLKCTSCKLDHHSYLMTSA